MNSLTVKVSELRWQREQCSFRIAKLKRSARFPKKIRHVLGRMRSVSIEMSLENVIYGLLLWRKPGRSINDAVKSGAVIYPALLNARFAFWPSWRIRAPEANHSLKSGLKGQFISRPGPVPV
jgi:hypothetical protein